jgi:hypothetical protein
MGAGFARRGLAPNIVPALGCAGALLGRRAVAGQSLAWLVFDGVPGCVEYLGLCFATAPIPGQRRRGLALITRPSAGSVAFSARDSITDGRARRTSLGDDCPSPIPTAG